MNKQKIKTNYFNYSGRATGRIKQTEMKTKRFQEIFNIVEPILIKEGDKKVYLGINKVPAKYDCRVVWDVLYQKMIAKIEELENEVKDLQSKLK